MKEDESALNATRLIEAAYEVFLLRAVDAAGLDHWRTEINSGRVTLMDFFLALMASTEFCNNSSAFMDKYAGSSPHLGFRDHSHNGEVTLLLRSMINEDKGIQIAVDVGAHGKFGSNTYDLLRHFGWRGVLVEANPRLIPKIKEEFSGCNFDVANVAVSSRPGKAKLYLGINDEISSIHLDWTAAWGAVRDFVEIDVETLPSVLGRFSVPKRFGLLSIDAEGEGLNLLEDALAAGYRPDWVILECHNALEIRHISELPVSDFVKGTYDIAANTSSNVIIRLKPSITM
jgi:FkbM family methyltransferase